MENTNISCDFRSYARFKQSHIHDYAQVVLPLSGELEMVAGGKRSRLTPSRAIIIGPDTPHDFESPRNGLFFVLDVPVNETGYGDKSRRLFPIERNRAFFGAISASQQRFLRFLSEEYYRSSESLFYCQSLLEAIISLIKISPENDTSTEEEPGYWNRDQVNTVRGAANYHGMSESTYRRTIRSIHGESPKKLQMEERLAAAEYLLLTTQSPVSAISFNVGFSSSSAFTNAFRRKFGMAPSDFRKVSRHS